MKIIQKITLVMLLLPLMLILVYPAVAQYDSDVVEPRFEDGAEVFGIDTGDNQTLSFFPQGCKSIDKVEVTTNRSIDGEVKITSNGEESPINDVSIDKPFEYCSFEWSGIDEEDISELKITTRVRKSWLEAENVSNDDIALYSFDGSEWQSNETQRDNDNAIYYYYNSGEVSFATHFAVGEFVDGVNLPFGLTPISLIICCVVFLIVLLLLGVLVSLSSRSRNRNVNIETY